MSPAHASRTGDPALRALAVAAAALVALETAILLASPDATAAEAIVPPAVASAYLAAGLVALQRRPHNRFGLLLGAGGAAFLAAGLENSDVPGLAAVGLICRSLPLAVTLHLLLAFPSGRVRGRTDRAVVAGGYAVALLLEAPQYLAGGDRAGTLRVTTDGAIADAGLWVQGAAGLALLAATAALLIRRLRAASAAERRTLAPLAGYGIAALAICAAGVVAANSAGGRLQPWAGVLQVAALLGLPLAFLAGLLRGAFARAGELEELAAGLAETSGAGSVEAALARALGDPGLRLAYRRDTGEWVDALGAPIAVPPPLPLRSAEAAVDGRTVGAVVYDGSLIADERLVGSAAGLAALAIDRTRLTADLRAAVRDLAESRRRIVEASDDERRRIARDLHDGAQQRIVLLGLEAQQLARRTEDADAATRAAALSEGMAAVLDELRGLVHGLMPPTLAERGIEPAARWLAGRMPIPVQVESTGLNGRLPGEVESTAYFVIAESLANSVKHADASSASVTIESAGGALTVEVRDDGAGGASLGGGTGLRGLADRVGALGGGLDVASPHGGGTVVRARIPCAS